MRRTTSVCLVILFTICRVSKYSVSFTFGSSSSLVIPASSHTISQNWSNTCCVLFYVINCCIILLRETMFWYRFIVTVS